MNFRRKLLESAAALTVGFALVLSGPTTASAQGFGRGFGRGLGGVPRPSFSSFRSLGPRVGMPSLRGGFRAGGLTSKSIRPASPGGRLGASRGPKGLPLFGTKTSQTPPRVSSLPRPSRSGSTSGRAGLRGPASARTTPTPRVRTVPLQSGAGGPAKAGGAKSSQRTKLIDRNWLLSGRGRTTPSSAARQRALGRFEKHHIFPWSERNRPVMKHVGSLGPDYHINSRNNLVLLPKSSGSRFNRSVHSGYTRQHRAYNTWIGQQLDRIEKIPDKGQWASAVQSLQSQIRAGLKGGLIPLK